MPFAAAYETRLQNRLIESLIFSAHVENPCRQLVKTNAFFRLFSRMEYALKNSGFLQNQRTAKPDWVPF